MNPETINEPWNQHSWAVSHPCPDHQLAFCTLHINQINHKIQTQQLHHPCKHKLFRETPFSPGPRLNLKVTCCEQTLFPPTTVKLTGV